MEGRSPSAVDVMAGSHPVCPGFKHQPQVDNPQSYTFRPHLTPNSGAGNTSANSNRYLNLTCSN